MVDVSLKPSGVLQLTTKKESKMNPSNDLLARIQQMKERSEKLEGTLEDQVRLALHLIIAMPELHYPEFLPALALIEAIAPRIRELSFTPEFVYTIKCPACGKHLGRNIVKPIRILCCNGKGDLISSYFLSRITNHFALDSLQDKKILSIYNQCLGEYYVVRSNSNNSNTSLTSNNTAGNKLSTTNVGEECP